MAEGITLETFQHSERRYIFLHRGRQGSPKNKKIQKKKIKTKGKDSALKNTVSHLPFPIKKKKTHAFLQSELKTAGLILMQQWEKQTDRQGQDCIQPPKHM